MEQSDASAAISRQARLTWIVALVLMAATVISTVCLAGLKPNPWVMAVLALGILLDLFWAMCVLMVRDKPRRVTGHALAGLFSSCLAMMMLGVCVACMYLMHTFVPSIANWKAERPQTPGSAVVVPIDTTPPPVVKREATRQPLKCEPVDQKPVAAFSLYSPQEMTEHGARITMLTDGPAIDCVWSADGKRAFLLCAPSTLVEVSIPQCVAKRKLFLDGKYSQMVMSKEGILLADSLLTDVLLVDSATLITKKKILLSSKPGAPGWSAYRRQIAGAAPSSVVMANAPEGAQFELWILDLAADQLILQPVRDDARYVAMTPDGRNVLYARRSAMYRIRIEGSNVIDEESGPFTGGEYPTRIEVSTDSKFAALICGDGNRAVAGFPAIAYGAHVYEVNRLSEPVVSIPGATRALAWDPVTGQIYSCRSQSDNCPLAVFEPEGGQPKEFGLVGPRRHSTHQICVHPEGRKLLLLTSGMVYWIDLTTSP